MKTGAKYIAEERNRQITEKGYDAKHDASIPVEDFISAGVSYGIAATEDQKKDVTTGESAAWWPWEFNTYKPKGTLENLIRGGAFYAAAIDRYLEEHPEERQEPERQYVVDESKPETYDEAIVEAEPAEAEEVIESEQRGDDGERDSEIQTEK